MRKLEQLGAKAKIEAINALWRTVMTRNEVLEKFKTLPPEAQKQVLDYIAFLETRYRPTKKKPSSVQISEEQFIGMWRGRVDLRDSSRWVRDVRKTEWGSAG